MIHRIEGKIITFFGCALLIEELSFLKNETSLKELKRVFLLWSDDVVLLLYLKHKICFFTW